MVLQSNQCQELNIGRKLIYLGPCHLQSKQCLGGPTKSKKRKKEKGEDAEKHPKRSKKTTKCSNCGQLGHNRRTCKNASSSQGPKEKGGRPPSNTYWAVAQRTKKAERLRRRYEPSSSMHPPIEPASSQVQSSSTQHTSQSTVATAQATAPANLPKIRPMQSKPRNKLPIKSITKNAKDPSN
ncbi:Zinc finger CCHC domain-containing protein 12 [Bienertia sinuspersici]